MRSFLSPSRSATTVRSSSSKLRPLLFSSSSLTIQAAAPKLSTQYRASNASEATSSGSGAGTSSTLKSIGGAPPPSLAACRPDSSCKNIRTSPVRDCTACPIAAVPRLVPWWPLNCRSTRPQGPQSVLCSGLKLVDASASASSPASPIGLSLTSSFITPHLLGAPWTCSGLPEPCSCSRASNSRCCFSASAKHTIPRSRMALWASLKTSRPTLCRRPSAKRVTAASSRSLLQRRQLRRPWNGSGTSTATSGAASTCQANSSAKDRISALFQESPSRLRSKFNSSRRPDGPCAASAISCSPRPWRPLPASASRCRLEAPPCKARDMKSASCSGERSFGVMSDSDFKISERSKALRLVAALRAPKKALNSAAFDAWFWAKSRCTKQSAAAAREAKPVDVRPQSRRSNEPEHPCVFNSIARTAAPASFIRRFWPRSTQYGLLCAAPWDARSFCCTEASGKKLRATASQPSGDSLFPRRSNFTSCPPELSCKNLIQLDKLHIASSVSPVLASESQVNEGQRKSRDTSKHGSCPSVFHPSRSSLVTRNGRSRS
mmetsp:Transcript_13930/g.27520  ORF Transcript_13930/g.27520 Transcript_13930/m.27520 type:complete len:548 (+) Transcript_13930:320-1963(+)